ncbi:TetR/AcrR family transcriptional regulator [Enterococcus sp. AZ072]|uniref:TetR/AcrR family transcriptional regulator n=1 Tax=unclassified Enterococcus TaxID=2608891 RepID=UPI003D2CAF76
MEIGETKEWIAEAIIRLLKSKSYSDITIANITDEARLGRRTFYRHFKSKDEVIELISLRLIDDFTANLLEKQAASLAEMMECYFEFWEANIDVFLLLKEARLLYCIEENIVDLVLKIALKVGRVPNDLEAAKQIINDHKYEFAYKLAGFWKLTIVWSEETPRKSPTEMSRIITEFMRVVR